MSNLPSSTIGSKRKARNDIASPPAQRPRLSQSESLFATHPQTTVRSIPQPDSIQAIIRDHCRIRLYVPPIAWTSDQLRLLTCQFRLQNLRRRGKQPTQPTQSASQDIGFQNDEGRATDGAAQKKSRGGRYSHAVRTATKLAQISTLVAKKSAVEDMLGAYNICISDSECLPFYFNRRAAVKLSTDGVFSNNSVAPSLAYITFDKIQSLRKKHVYTPPYKIVNEIANAPGLRVRQKRLGSLEPQIPAEDPYIVTILIALAQGQRRRRQQQEVSQGAGAKIKTKNQTSHVDVDTTLGVTKLRTARSCSLSIEQMAWNEANYFKVQVLALSGVAADVLYVYTANIHSGFLNKFDEPSHYSPSCPVAVTYCRVPLASSNMPKKLHRLLCAGSCSFCSCDKVQDPCTAC